jgi:hypothetical protein
MNIFLAPRSNETSYKNFLSTIESGIDYLIVEPFLEDDGRRILSPNNKLFAWGTKEAKRTSWEKMEKGDLVLFYKGKEGDEKESKFLYAGKVQYKQFSSELGLAMWPPKKGEDPWNCVYFLEELTPVYVPISAITSLCEDYHFSIVQGFMPINENAVKNFITKYGTIDEFIKEFRITDLGDETTELEEKSVAIAHREAQMLLLKMGNFLGFETYCPDRNYEAYGEKLGEYTTLRDLPTNFIGAAIIPFVRQIDVIWFNNGVPEYAFEVEESTGVGSGLNRLNQLTPVAKKLFVIAPSKEYPKFEKFINGNTYSRDREKFTFKDYGQLERYFNSVSEFTALKKSFLEE